MFDLDKWQEIFHTMKQNKLRTFLTGFSVAWGIFILIILLGFGNGYKNGTKNNFKEEANNSIWVWSGETSIPHKGIQPGKEIQFRNDDHSYLEKNMDNLDKISARYNIDASTNLSYKGESASYRVQSVFPDHRYIENTELLKGRLLNQKDIKEYRKVIAISDVVANDLFKEDKPLGKHIMLNNISFKVIGVFHEQGDEREMQKVYIPITTAQRSFKGSNKLSQIMFTTNTRSYKASKKIEKKLRAQLATKHGFSPKDPRAIRINNNLERYQKFLSLFEGIEVFIWIIGIGTIIAGIAGVSNIMIIIVKERTQEIGVRKALGATPNSILGLIMLEAIVITGVSGYMGILTGVGLLELINHFISQSPGMSQSFSNPTINIQTAIFANILLILAGLISGIFPAKRAAAVRPIEALRDE
ncbi:MAG: ABC transporter permease [Flavobacteriales bacterium]